MSTDTKPDKASKGRPKAEREPVKNPKATDLRFMSHKARAAIRAKAVALYEESGNITQVADEIAVPRTTLRRWLQEAGLVGKKTDAAPPDPEDCFDEDGEIILPEDEEAEQTEEEAAIAQADAELIAGLTDVEKRDIIRIAQILAREQEFELIEALSDGAGSPAEQYQSYAAQMGMKLLKDNKSKIRGPRTVKELAVLDAIIRRNLGIDQKGGGGKGGGGGALHVDVRILNQGPVSAEDLKRAEGREVEVEAREA